MGVERLRLQIVLGLTARRDKPTRSQGIARTADRTASQYLWGSRDVIGHVTIR